MTSISRMTRPPDPAELADSLSRRIDAYATNPGKAPLKLLHWALGQLEECTRTRSIPTANVIDVVMAAIKDDLRPKPTPAAIAPGTVAAGTNATAGAAAGTATAAAGTTSAAGSAAAATAAAGTAAAVAAGTVASSSAGGGGGDTQKASSGSGSGSAGSGSKGKVVFTPLYGCDEGSTGVGPVCSILEVTMGRTRTA